MVRVASAVGATGIVGTAITGERADRSGRESGASRRPFR